MNCENICVRSSCEYSLWLERSRDLRKPGGAGRGRGGCQASLPQRLPPEPLPWPRPRGIPAITAIISWALLAQPAHPPGRRLSPQRQGPMESRSSVPTLSGLLRGHCPQRDLCPWEWLTTGIPVPNPSPGFPGGWTTATSSLSPPPSKPRRVCGAELVPTNVFAQRRTKQLGGPSPRGRPSHETVPEQRRVLFTLQEEEVVHVPSALRRGHGERAQKVPIALEQTGHEAEEGALHLALQPGPAAAHGLVVGQQELQGRLLLWPGVCWGAGWPETRGQAPGASPG